MFLFGNLYGGPIESFLILTKTDSSFSPRFFCRFRQSTYTTPKKNTPTILSNFCMKHDDLKAGFFTPRVAHVFQRLRYMFYKTCTLIKNDNMVSRVFHESPCFRSL